MPEGKLSEAGIRRDLEDSLRRLQTDYIDLYTEHQMDEGTEEQVAEVMGNGFLSGKYSSRDTFQKNDLCSVITRFNKENMDANK